jgi:hypothetical protein
MTRKRAASVDQIVEDANAVRLELATLDHALQQEIDAIDFKAFKAARLPTDQETEQRKKLRATQGEIGEAFVVLGFVTAQRLDNSAEAAHLLRQLQVINAGLEDDLDRLERLEKFAETAATVADALAKATAKIAKLAAQGVTGVAGIG